MSNDSAELVRALLASLPCPGTRPQSAEDGPDAARCTPGPQAVPVRVALVHGAQAVIAFPHDTERAPAAELAARLAVTVADLPGMRLIAYPDDHGNPTYTAA